MPMDCEMFECFNKIVGIEGKKESAGKEDGVGEVTTSSDANSNNNQMSSRGGEASGAAASGRAAR